MITNRGFTNENNLQNKLNNVRIKDLNPNLKTMIKRMFGSLVDEELLRCEKVEGFIKPDLKITYKGVSKYVSVKSGKTCNVHEEQVSSLVPFLKELGYSKDDINVFLQILYRDGTTDGTGEKVLEFIDSRAKFAGDITKFNEIFNKDKSRVEKIIERCLFKGNKSENIEAEYIYFGNENYGVLCSKTQIMKHISRRTWDYMHNAHIGPLQFRAHSFENKIEPSGTNRRHQCDFWWARLREDLEYIEERYWG